MEWRMYKGVCAPTNADRMRRLIWLGVCLGVAHATSLAGLITASSDTGGRIWGSADNRDFPTGRYRFFAQLIIMYVNTTTGNYFVEYCGGTLIKSSVIITAAHCMYPSWGASLYSVGVVMGHDVVCKLEKRMRYDGTTDASAVDATPSCPTDAVGPGREYLGLVYPFMRYPPRPLTSNTFQVQGTLRDGTYVAADDGGTATAYAAFGDVTTPPWSHQGSTGWVQLTTQAPFTATSVRLCTNAATAVVHGSLDGGVTTRLVSFTTDLTKLRRLNAYSTVAVAIAASTPYTTYRVTLTAAGGSFTVGQVSFESATPRVDLCTSYLSTVDAATKIGGCDLSLVFLDVALSPAAFPPAWLNLDADTASLMVQGSPPNMTSMGIGNTQDSGSGGFLNNSFLRTATFNVFDTTAQYTCFRRPERRVLRDGGRLLGRQREQRV